MKKVLGIDLGGTKIIGGLVNEEGEILKKSRRDTPKTGRQAVLQELIAVIEELYEEGILGIGIGSPGCIDSDRGRVLEIGGNISGWAGTDIRGELGKVFPGMKIFVENDANVAGLCEKWLGAGREFENFVMLTLGTGVGGAVYTDKSGILKGYNFNGAELGHSILYPRGRQCNCGQRGCVDNYLSGVGLELSYLERTGKKKKAKDILEESRKDPLADQVVDRYTEELAIYLSTIKNIFDPQGIIIGGGVINSKDIWWDRMMVHYASQCNTPDSLTIVPAHYLNDSGMIGAARAVFLGLGY